MKSERRRRRRRRRGEEKREISPTGSAMDYQGKLKRD